MRAEILLEQIRDKSNDIRKRKWLGTLVIGIFALGLISFFQLRNREEQVLSTTTEGYIKWVDYQVTKEAMQRACRLDIESYGKQVHLDWITLLSYAAVRGGGEFDKKSLSYIEEAAKQLESQEMTKEKYAEKYQYFTYYSQAYEAVLGGMLGEYQIQQEDTAGAEQYEKKYGLKAFSPIAKGFPYQHYDDFGVGRTFGYKRKHLGHDMMGQIGTPIICVESGYVEALGWNQYGGWRIGVRSFDQKRYYYYAHLRQNRPYAEGLKEGDVVTAGDVIGYMGHTGYSSTENVNNIEVVHLHIGMQLIFDESQKDGNGEIWIDFYQIAQFLAAHQSEAIRNEETKEWKRKYAMIDPNVQEYENDGSNTQLSE